MLLFPTSVGDDFDLNSIESIEELIGAVLDNFAKFASDDQVNKWREQLVKGDHVDYNNRDSILEFYETIKMQYGPHHVGNESCINDITLYLADFKLLSRYGTIGQCGWCGRWVFHLLLILGWVILV